MRRALKYRKFFTSTVFLSFATGTVLITLGATDLLHYLLPDLIPVQSAAQTIIKTIGVTFVGSGVFSAIIKSSEYSEIFSNVLGEIIWSKKYIQKRTDKKEIWSMVSRLTYEEKFPLISSEIEDIITNHYFPVKHNFYVEDYDFSLNITDYNEDFWKQVEILKVTVKPINATEKIIYTFTSSIDLPKTGDNVALDITMCKISSITVNGKPREVPTARITKDETCLQFEFGLGLHYENEYELVIKREKILSKKRNPDKRNFAPYIIKDAKISVIIDINMNIGFHKMGTINDFQKSEEHINKDVKILTWNYKGLILPEQGFIIIQK